MLTVNYLPAANIHVVNTIGKRPLVFVFNDATAVQEFCQTWHTLPPFIARFRYLNQRKKELN